jgi:hypothetical protein
LAALLAYSQTAAFAWDEGYHLLAEQLIALGKTPYLDFCFPQAPLNAWWNAMWMRITGDTWREVHALSAVVTAGTVWLSADFLRTRLPVAEWRLPAAIAAAILIGLHAEVLEYATTGQPYALTLLMIVAAFRVAVLAVGRTGLALTATAGLLSSAGAACSLLVAAAPLVLLIWLVLLDPTRRRLAKSLAFLAGAALPWLPVFWLFTRGPRQVFFNLFEYHMFYRRANWEDATQNDWKVLAQWLISPQALLLGALAVGGLWAIARWSSWERMRRAEFLLCGWLAAAIGCELATAHPTFEWYFVLIIPFLAIPAAAGLPVVCSRIAPRVRPWQAVAVLSILFSLGCARALYSDRYTMTWPELESVARKVSQVTPPLGTLWSDEQIYFLTRRSPAEGTELSYAEVIDLPPDLARILHIVPLEELDRRAAAGVFATVSTCEESEQIEALGLPRIFRHQEAVGACHVFWDPVAEAIR